MFEEEMDAPEHDGAGAAGAGGKPRSSPKQNFRLQSVSILLSWVCRMGSGQWRCLC